MPLISRLPRFPVKGVFVAKPAVFLGFHSIGMVLLFLHGVVVPLLAVCTSQHYPCPHLARLSFLLALKPLSDNLRKRKLSLKRLAPDTIWLYFVLELFSFNLY